MIDKISHVVFQNKTGNVFINVTLRHVHMIIAAVEKQ